MATTSSMVGLVVLLPSVLPLASSAYVQLPSVTTLCRVSLWCNSMESLQARSAADTPRAAVPVPLKTLFSAAGSLCFKSDQAPGHQGPCPHHGGLPLSVSLLGFDSASLTPRLRNKSPGGLEKS